MFYGEYRHAIDAKSRLFIPARLRQGLGDRFVMTKGLDGCLALYPPAEWQALEDKLRSLPYSRKDARAFVRFLFAGAAECEPDKQGRILIPPPLKEYAALEKETIIIGAASRVEIWAAERWEAYLQATQDSVESIAESIVDLDL
ncbi:MAG: division/cell wall cluster transcriptional repressor MraZ [Desulfurispora sp.]|uniref:division/cell wall cluster transcriptional repressor MraZ n=1 Tax=Desulfurispora sp. TaxID=3014275 RepID=UPI00404ADF44